MNRAVFLDRDGTIIPDRGYLATADGVFLPPENGTALAKLSRAGYLLVVVTNQSGIGRGYFKEDMVHAQHARLRALAEEYGARIDSFVFCPHTPAEGCACRKPSPLMIVREAKRLQIDLAISFMVGDKLSDVEAGLAAGCRTVLIADKITSIADITVPGLPAAVEAILSIPETMPTDSRRAERDAIR